MAHYHVTVDFDIENTMSADEQLLFSRQIENAVRVYSFVNLQQGFNLAVQVTHTGADVTDNDA